MKILKHAVMTSSHIIYDSHYIITSHLMLHNHWSWLTYQFIHLFKVPLICLGNVELFTHERNKVVSVHYTYNRATRSCNRLHTVTVSLSFLGSWIRRDAVWRSKLIHLKRASACWFLSRSDAYSLLVAFSLSRISANWNSKLVLFLCSFSSSPCIC